MLLVLYPKKGLGTPPPSCQALNVTVEPGNENTMPFSRLPTLTSTQSTGPPPTTGSVSFDDLSSREYLYRGPSGSQTVLK
jgi:hypothetical protein